MYDNPWMSMDYPWITKDMYKVSKHNPWISSDYPRMIPKSAGPACGGHQAAGHPFVIPIPMYHVSYVPSSQSQNSQFRSQDLKSQVSGILG